VSALLNLKVVCLKRLDLLTSNSLRREWRINSQLQEAIRKKRGGIWLELTPEQYAKLGQPTPKDFGKS